VEKLLLQIVESLYLDLKKDGRAYRGTLIDLAGRTGISLEGENFMENLDNLLPIGETGTLLWIQSNGRDDKEQI
jgi:hypothetical protein